MKKKTFKEKLKGAISKIELVTCDVCGELVDKEEKKKGDGACFKCWDK